MGPAPHTRSHVPCFRDGGSSFGLNLRGPAAPHTKIQNEMKLPEAAGRGGEEGLLRAAGADLLLVGSALGVLFPVALGKRATLVIPP